MKKIYLIRHGETNFNAESRMLGRMDVPLNENGIEQATKLAERLRYTQIKQIYSSPLERCLLTTNIVNNYHQKEIKVSENLIEHAKGAWEGLSHEQIEKQYPTRYRQFSAGEDILPPGGETFKDVLERIKPFLNHIIQEKEEEILVVAHGGVNRVILGYLAGLDIKETYALEQGNCCLNTITYRPHEAHPSIDFNSINHLSDAVKPHFFEALDPAEKMVSDWFKKRTYHHNEFKLEDLLEMKGEETISIVIPTKNEEKTIGNVVRTLKSSLMDGVGLVDELIVVDSNSDDETEKKAREAGAEFHVAGKYFKENFIQHGKGENLWQSLYLTKGSIIIWLDADIENIDPRFVIGIVGPLLKSPEISYVKAFYERPIQIGNAKPDKNGGRVTEIGVRPMLNHFFKELSGFFQPLSGEYAGRRSLLEQLPFYIGYGVEVGHLIDILSLAGLDVMAQVDLDVRYHRNRPTSVLGKMAFEIDQVLVEKINERFNTTLKTSNQYTVPVNYDGNYSLKTTRVEKAKREPIIRDAFYRKKFHNDALCSEIERTKNG